MANTHSIDLELSSSQYLSIADASQTGLDLGAGGADFSIEFWVKLETAQSGTPQSVVSKYLSAGDQRSYDIGLGLAGGKQTVQLTTSSNGTGAGALITQTWNTDDDASVNLGTGVWHHIAVTYDTSAGSAILYVDGSSVGAKGSGNTTIYNGTAPFVIGAIANPTFYVDGLIDEVRVWSDIRTAQEIVDNYLTELVGNEANLVGYWKLNNDLLDATANNNDLTNNNAAAFSADIPSWSNDYTQDLNETVTLVDTISRSTGKTLNEVVTLVDTINVAALYFETLDETLTLVDTGEQKVTAKEMFETLTLVETVYKDISRDLTEAIVLADTQVLNRYYTAELTEAIVLVDSIATQTAKSLAEVIALIDTNTTSASYARTLTETATLVENVTKTAEKVVTDALTLVDSLSKVGTFARSVNETVTLQERFQGLMNGQNIAWFRKYTEQAGTFIKKYLDIP